jgi:hypothetical protein
MQAKGTQSLMSILNEAGMNGYVNEMGLLP